MPMIDVYAPAHLFADEVVPDLLVDLARSVIRHEGLEPRPPFTTNTAAYLHALPGVSIATAASPEATVVRVQVMTPPGVLDRTQQRDLVADLTRLVARAAGDATLAERTSVLLTEAAEGGWGVGGVALGRAEFAALASHPG